MKYSIIAILTFLAVGPLSWSRTFTKTEWKVSYYYSNAYSTDEKEAALIVSGRALFSDDGALCEVTVKNKVYKCKPNFSYENLYIRASEWQKLVLESTQVHGSNAERTRAIIIDNLKQREPTDTFGLGGMNVQYESYQIHDPKSNFESVHARSSAHEIPR